MALVFRSLKILFSASLWLLLGMGGILGGCSSSLSLKKPLPPRVSPPIRPEKQKEELSERLKNLREEARQGGEKMVQFLATDLFLKADYASLRGDAELAAFVFKQINLLIPHDEYLKKRYSLELIRLGQLEEAKSHLEELFKKRGDSFREIGLLLGGVHATLEENTQAKQVYLKVLKFYPQDSDTCLFLAKLYESETQYQRAEELLQSCLKNNKNQATLYYHWGKLALLQKKYKQANGLFSLALSLKPDYTQVVSAQALAWQEQGKEKRALRVYERFLKKNPDDYLILVQLVQLKLSLQSFENLIPHLERLVALNPQNLNLKVQLGILYSGEEEVEKAKGVFREILSEVPNSNRVLYYLGSLNRQTGDDEKAIHYFSQISRDDLLFVDAHLQVAQLLKKGASHPWKKENRSEREKAVHRFVSFATEKIKEEKNLALDLSLLLADFYELNNEVEKAIETLLRVKNLEGYQDDHEYYLASLYEKIKDYKSSRALIEKILEKDPENPNALNFLGYSLVEAGENLDRAYKLISRAIAQSPRDGYIRDSLGWYYYKKGQYGKALREIRKAWKLVKNDAVIAKHLAMVYQKLERYNQAQKYFEEALKYSQTQREKVEIHQAIVHLNQLKRERLPAATSSPSSKSKEK